MFSYCYVLEFVDFQLTQYLFNTEHEISVLRSVETFWFNGETVFQLILDEIMRVFYFFSMETCR